MLTKFIHQLENVKDTVYSPETCRIFLNQAYQELSILRISATNEANLDDVCESFCKIEEEVLKAFDDDYHLAYKDLQGELNQFIAHLPSAA